MNQIQQPKSKQPIPSDAKCVFQGKIFFVYQWQQKLFDGSYNIFEKIKRPSTVMVLPITTEGKIVITEQEQPGEGKFIGLIGGIVDDGEEIIDAVKRELMEESGFIASEFILWDSIQLINKIEWSVYTFIAKGLEQKQTMNPDAGERIKLWYVSFDEFLNITHQENFRDIEVKLKIHHIENDKSNMDEFRKLLQA